MPKLAAFPKAYMDPLCVDGSMTIRQWIELAATLDIDGWSSSRLSGARRPQAWLKLAQDCRRPRPDDSDALLLARLHASRSGISPRAGRAGKGLDRHDGRARRQYCRVLCGQRRRDPPEDGLDVCRGVHSEACRPRGGAASR